MKQKTINIPLDEGRKLTKSIGGKITDDIESCEKNLKFFPPKNKFTQGIQKSIERIKKLLNDLENARAIKLMISPQEDTAYSLMIATEVKQININPDEKTNENQLRLFTSAVRHDIRNPLASALGYADLIKMKGNEDEKNHAENISKSLRNILDKLTIGTKY